MVKSKSREDISNDREESKKRVLRKNLSGVIDESYKRVSSSKRR
jgi:hypothetical protein